MNSLLMAGGVFFSFFFACLGLFFGIRAQREKQALQNKFKQWEIQRRGLLHSLGVKLQSRLDKMEWFHKLDRELKGASLNISPFRFLLLFSGLATASMVLVHLLFGLGLLWDMLLGFEAVRFGARRYLKMQQKKIIQRIDKQLPEVSRLLSSSIKAGLNIQQGLDVVSQEMKDPAGSIFRNLSNELKLGSPIEDAFQGLMEKVRSRELKLLANTILVQRKAGGNLALVLEEMAQTLEQRHRVNEEIEGSTAESKFVALVLPFMPIMAAVILNTVFPGALLTLLTPLGLLVGAMFIGLQLLGFLLIRNISNIRV